jgi:hypothetical protein
MQRCSMPPRISVQGVMVRTGCARVRDGGVEIGELCEAFEIATGWEDDRGAPGVGLGEDVRGGGPSQADVLGRIYARRRSVCGQSREVEARVEDAGMSMGRSPPCEILERVEVERRGGLRQSLAERGSGVECGA